MSNNVNAQSSLCNGDGETFTEGLPIAYQTYQCRMGMFSRCRGRGGPSMGPQDDRKQDTSWLRIVTVVGIVEHRPLEAGASA
jgi:hypothetical protein